MDIIEIKQRMYAMRNGIIADAYHKASAPWGVVFGLQIPQIAEIARDAGYDEKLAKALWCDANVRESRLMACYLFDPATTSTEDALRLAATTQAEEERDILSFCLLKRMPQAKEVLALLDAAAEEQSRLTASSLRRHLS